MHVTLDWTPNNRRQNHTGLRSYSNKGYKEQPAGSVFQVPPQQLHPNREEEIYPVESDDGTGIIRLSTPDNAFGE